MTVHETALALVREAADVHESVDPSEHDCPEAKAYRYLEQLLERVGHQRLTMAAYKANPSNPGYAAYADARDGLVRFIEQADATSEGTK